MRRLPKPIMALVQGRALAEAVASRRRAISFWRRSRAVRISGGATRLCARDRHDDAAARAGEKIAFDLAATGRLLDGTEAAAVGLASRVYDDADFEEQAAAVLRVLAETSPSALAFTKQQFYQLDGLSFEDGLRLGADVNAGAGALQTFARL